MYIVLLLDEMLYRYLLSPFCLRVNSEVSLLNFGGGSGWSTYWWEGSIELPTIIVLESISAFKSVVFFIF
jgi:hypothetical protein